MLKQDKQLILLDGFIKQLPSLKKSRDLQQNHERILKLEILNKLLPGLISIYRRQLVNAQKDIADFCKQNKRLLSPTTFEVMRKHNLEETHSNVIAYLLAKDKGYELLKGIFLYLYNEKGSNIPKLNKNSFIVLREKEIEGKRIDIWIESRDFFVVIENKFYSKLHMVDEGITQADFYRIKTLEKYRHKEPFFIILDLKGTEFCDGYRTMDYKDLLIVLQDVKISFRDDFVYDDYLFLLQRLLSSINNISRDGIKKVKYLSNINNLNEVLLNGTKKSFTRI
jgi:hypothetical protein